MCFSQNTQRKIGNNILEFSHSIFINVKFTCIYAYKKYTNGNILKLYQYN